MLLLDNSSAVERGDNQGRVRKRTRIVAPSAVPGVIPEFLDEVPFNALGRLNEAVVQQPKPEYSTEIIRWLSLQPHGMERNPLIAECAAKNPEWFKSWDTLTMFDSSLRLPRDEVAVFVVKDPVSIPDDPPRSVRERWDMANLKCPEAPGFYLEPFFDRPTAADAKAVTATDLQNAVDVQWNRLLAKTRHWAWIFRFERAVLEWSERRERRRELKLQSELYLEMLTQKEAVAQSRRPAAQQEVVRVPLDDRLAARRRERRREESDAFVERQLASMPIEVRRQVQDIETDLQELGAVVRARGPMRQEEARQTLSRREFNVAVFLGLVSFPGQERFRRYDPLLAIQLPGERGLRLVAHWDRWMANRNGQVQLCTFVHV